MRNTLSMILKIAISSSLFFSCISDDSSSINPTIPIYQDLSVEYDITQNKTYVAANFNKSNAAGTNVTLDGNSSIFFNNEEPDYANIGPYFYTKTFPGKEDIVFRFTRNGKKFQNTASVNEIETIGIPASFTHIGKDGTTILTWEGAPVSEDEEVQIIVETQKTGINITYINETGINSGTVGVPPDTPAGKATLYINRNKILPLEQTDGSAGGRMKLIYTVSKSILIR
ncbi:MAG: hypothetical protein PUB21_06735 [Bacteroidales bacterium]|nr:hypothetical protein [Bacteroidales bacterium]